MSVWKCDCCDLFNNEIRNTCQACFKDKPLFHFLPKEIEEIIFDYKNQLEISETREKLNKEFEKRKEYLLSIRLFFSYFPTL